MFELAKDEFANWRSQFVTSNSDRMVEGTKEKLQNQDKNIEVVFSYLDELITKGEDQLPRKRIGFKPNDLN